MDILEDVRVEGVLPVGRVRQPSKELGLHLGGSLFSEKGVDGGLGGGEGDALGDGDGQHSYHFLSFFVVLIIPRKGLLVNHFFC